MAFIQRYIRHPSPSASRLHGTLSNSQTSNCQNPEEGVVAVGAVAVVVAA
jgi:hypothetical protein